MDPAALGLGLECLEMPWKAVQYHGDEQRVCGLAVLGAIPVLADSGVSDDHGTDYST